MAGLGAVFDLYAAYKESRKDDKKETEEPKLEPDPEESVEGYIDEESEWHYVIENQAWDALLEMMQQYDYQKYKPKQSDTKKKRRLRVVGAAIWVKNKVVPRAIAEEPPISPLLALNEQRQTPLHLAVKYLAPDKYVIRLALCEKRAALIADEEGKLPIHYSCLFERSTAVTDRLIRANFHHMQREDNAGKTALCYAVMKAIEHNHGEESQHCYWGIPRNREDAEWQERQEHIWSKARFILLCYSTRRKIFVQAERDLLLQILDNAGPPSLVEVSILAAQGMLQSDPTLASSALRLFLKRDYPIKNLQLLLHHFPDENVESVEAARKLLTEYYYDGCRKDPLRQFSFREEMEKHALESNYKRSLLCQEWWNKIRCLLRLCGHQNSKEKKENFDNKYLLHAALSNSDTPPSLVQLLMVMTPEAIRLQHPFNQSLLIHLICRNWKFNLYPHSQKIGVQVDLEEPPMEQVLKITLASDATLTRKRHRDRLPLHYAIATSKSIDFLDSLVRKDRKSLSIRDPQTKLYPFQMAALGTLNKNAALWAYARYSPDVWKNLEPEDRAKAVNEIIKEQQLEQLNTIYYLLRQYPAAIVPTSTHKKAHAFKDTRGKGMVSAHFLLWAYARGDGDDYILLEDNLRLIRTAIEEKSIPKELESWWSKLKFWIRYCYTGNESLPNNDDFLLHAAVANSDVPPVVIELILASFPHSISLPVSGQNEYPLHIAVATPHYQPQPFELSQSKSTIQLLLEAYPDAANIQSPSGYPLDIARIRGRRLPEEINILMEHRGTKSSKMSSGGHKTDLEDEIDVRDVYDLLQRSSLKDSFEKEIDFLSRQVSLSDNKGCIGLTMDDDTSSSTDDSSMGHTDDSHVDNVTNDYPLPKTPPSLQPSQQQLQEQQAFEEWVVPAPLVGQQEHAIVEENKGRVHCTKNSTPFKGRSQDANDGQGISGRTLQSDDVTIKSVVKLQSFVRGCIGRDRVKKLVNELIAELKADLIKESEDGAVYVA